MWDKLCIRKLDVACFALGAITFVIATTMSVCAIIYITMEAHFKTGALGSIDGNITDVTDPLPTLRIQKPAKQVIFGIVLVIGVLWMLFSVAFLFGIKKNKLSCVVAYFLFGVAISVVSLITAMLEFLAKQWPLAVATLIVTALYMQCLRVVYAASEQLQQGKTLGDREQLILDEEFSVEDD